MFAVRLAKALAIIVAAVVSANGCSHSTRPPTSSPSAASNPASTHSLFTTAAPWNADISGAAKAERSEAIIHALTAMGGWGTGGLHVDFSMPVFFADRNAPQVQVVGAADYCYGGRDCDTVPARMPLPANAYFEGSPNPNCDTSGATEGQEDCHLLVVDRDQRKLYEIYHGSKSGENLTAQGFFVWDLTKQYPDTLRGDQCTSADAAGFPIAAMTPTADEVASGIVDHAIRFILPNNRMKAGVYVRPATHAGGPDSTDANAPPYGVRFRLRADFDESGYSKSERVIIAALKKYGMLLSDGGQVPLTFADDRTSTKKWAELGISAQSFNGIAVDQFEVVQLGPEVKLTYDCVRNQ
ncbi:hypothetical protein A9W99_12030 [Mycobacterium sp. 1164966.3]|uniref:hypothetical protein n=1 Tax=Mycobacterium sp. 1164966.3 TaxID=1856861 RepID=UPI0008003B63|nr:hypothetical protein [Mycobacterium sp. 1164966.3]OBA82124.1 hypothetical protein A9W99_12030 [Mycobacterium sp. 1164966.3]